MKNQKKSKKPSKQIDSEPTSKELQDMIKKVTHQAHSLREYKATERSVKKSKTSKLYHKGKTLGHAFDQIGKEEMSDPSLDPFSSSDSSSSSLSSD